jgi:chemotaxis protein CheX
MTGVDLSADDPSQLAAVETGQVVTIATEVFAAMVDGRRGLLTSWPGGPVRVSDPLHAWVDLGTEPASRVQLTADAGTADDLTRAFLRMDAAEPVAEADVVDAFGEIVNVFGGNIKALPPEHVGLTLPEVSRLSPSGAGAARLNEVRLAWRGHPLVVSLWTI